MKFSEIYFSILVVYVFLLFWDVSNGVNLWVDFIVDRVDEIGFDLVFKIW